MKLEKQHVVKQNDVRLLREALAYCANHAHPTLKPVALNALARYAEAVSEYCEHPESVAVLGVQKCLDCGNKAE